MDDLIVRFKAKPVDTGHPNKLTRRIDDFIAFCRIPTADAPTEREKDSKHLCRMAEYSLVNLCEKCDSKSVVRDEDRGTERIKEESDCGNMDKIINLI
jgi:hypothetical protein